MPKLQVFTISSESMAAARGIIRDAGEALGPLPHANVIQLERIIGAGVERATSELRDRMRGLDLLDGGRREPRMGGEE